MTILNANEYITKGDVMQILQNAYTDGRIQAKDGCASALDDIAAIKADVQPVKHGRWIGITEYCKMNGYIPSGMGIYYWCSECGKEEQKTSDYCPHCGARMDGEQNV